MKMKREEDVLSVWRKIWLKRDLDTVSVCSLNWGALDLRFARSHLITVIYTHATRRAIIATGTGYARLSFLKKKTNEKNYGKKVKESSPA